MRPDALGGPPNAPLQLPLPRAVAELVPQQPRAGDHLGLWLDRFLRREPGSWELKAKLRASELSALAGPDAWEVKAVADVLARRALGALAPGRPYRLPDGRQLRRLQLRQAGPMVVDHGRASAVEAGLSFDWILGAPRIPGSALRGAARAALEPHAADEVFGTQERAGPVHIYDALPARGRFYLHVDVLTPHVKDYYEGRSPPGEWMAPEPATFLTVAGTEFVVDLEGPEDLVDVAAEAVQAAMTGAGVGAKSRAGYGWFLPATPDAR